MIFCKECGTELGDEAVFCTTCGAKIERAEAVQQATQQYQQPQYQQPMQPRKPISKKLVAAIIAVVVVIIAGLVAKNTVFAPKIDLEECLLVDVTGFDGAGRLEIDIDYDTLMWEISDMNDNISDDKINELVSSISFEPSEDENLSNGQEITIKLKYNSKLAARSKIKIASDEWTYTVEGLEEVKEVDPFEYVDVTFNGTAPTVEATYSAKQVPDLGTLDYEFDIKEGLSNGDVVTLSCVSNEENIVGKGYKLTSTTKTYTVENMAEYVTDPATISGDYLTNLQDIAIEMVNEDVEGLDEFEFATSTPVYEGLVVSSPKTFSTYGEKNQVFLIYSATVAGGKEDFEEMTFYFPIKFNDVEIMADGTMSYSRCDKAYYLSNILYDNNNRVFPGYDDATLMYSEKISNSNNNIVMSDGLSEILQ